VRRPGFRIGALVGALLTAPLVVVFYLGWKLAGLPFVPFQIFDWVTRVLPGGLLTFGIDTMVKVIRALGVTNTSAAAKAAEQSMAILVLVVAGAVAGAVLYALLRAMRSARGVLAGTLLGALAGAAVVFLRRGLGRQDLSALAGDIFTAVAFVAWGWFLGRTNRRLTRETIHVRGEAARSVHDDRIERLDRRRFLIRLGGATATITVVGAAVGALAGRRRSPESVAGHRWSADNPLPNAFAEVKPAPGTRAEYTPLEDHYRIDITTIPPDIDESSWRLKVGGLVERPLELTLDRIRSYEPLHQFVTLACISNPVGGTLIGTTRWTGASLQHVLPDFRLAPNATHLKISSADKFYEVVPVDAIRADERVMLAYDWDGVPLTTKHGFPLRIYIPDLYGMKQPKWIESIEAIDHWEPGYWVKRGWDRIARMKGTAVIDAVSVDMMLAEANRDTLIPIGGIAHAGARGISKVEVRSDDGPWRPAKLRAPLSGLTWVLWRYEWPFQPGRHTLTVRCYDGKGALQIAEPAPPHPSGASGYHEKSIMM
jgi:DMSO/TMAO reductase YedYZ molybdopterin-dependent catalytic subunit